MPSYAEGTHVPTAQTRLELENLLRNRGATEVGLATSDRWARLMFTMQGRTISFRVTMPDETARAITHTATGQQRSAGARHTALAQEHRRLWRALLLVVKAKLESAESGIETFESAFLANIVLPDGSTVADSVAPAIAASYADGKVRPLLALTD